VTPGQPTAQQHGRVGGAALYALTDDALDRRAALRRVLWDRHAPGAAHERIVGDQEPDAQLWRQLAQEIGICAVLVPESFGGLALGHGEFAMVAGELAAVLYGGPFWGTVVLGLPALVALADSSDAAAGLVTQVAAGELTVALAHRDGGGGRPLVDSRGAGYVLSGRVELVVDAADADVLCVVAGAGRSLGLFAVARQDVERRQRASVDPTRRLYDLTLEQSAATLIADGPVVEEAVRSALRVARLAAAAEAVRGAEEALALSVDYAKHRTQFGKPIGVHQAVKHKCADGLIAIQAAKSGLLYACAAMDADVGTAEPAVIAAKAMATDAFVKVASDAIQIHGTFGYTRDALTQSYFRRARWLSLVLGSSGTERVELARMVLSTSTPGDPGPPDELFGVGLPPADDPRRLEVRAWLSEHPRPTGRQLLEAGFMVPHWAPPVGLDADAGDVVVIDQELRRAGVERPRFPLARDFVAPLIAAAGSAQQQDRYILPMLSGEDIWCELFSEPEAGSDLASLTTAAVRTSAGYRVNGVKTWTSQAHLARYGLLLARTDPQAPKHRGISCFVVPMDAPGLSMQPIVSMEGERKWSLVFLDDVEVGQEDLIGAENQGWRIALDVLANERLSMSATPGLLWGEGPSFADLLGLARLRNADTELPDHLRQRLVRGYEDALALQVMRIQAMGRTQDGKSGARELVPEVRRALADSHGQSMLELWRDLHDDAGVLLCPDGEGNDDWADHYFAARSLTLGGGTSEIQRNILAERVLGLPRA
jgi:3-oxochol-4-en-24-oyl-CoA dehydrogenase